MISARLAARGQRVLQSSWGEAREGDRDSRSISSLDSRGARPGPLQPLQTREWFQGVRAPKVLGTPAWTCWVGLPHPQVDRSKVCAKWLVMLRVVAREEEEIRIVFNSLPSDFVREVDGESQGAGNHCGMGEGSRQRTQLEPAQNLRFVACTLLAFPRHEKSLHGRRHSALQ
jgi:hypothetical protein